LNNTEKTIPYRLSPAELENLRILRGRTLSSSSLQDTEEKKISTEETDARHSDRDRLEKETVRKP